MIKFLPILALSLLISVASNCLANDNKDYADKVKEKALRGLTNMVTGPLEIPKNIINTTNESNIVLGTIGGLLKGTLVTIARITSGFADFITAPLPTKPIIQPERVWDDFDAETTYSERFRLDE